MSVLIVDDDPAIRDLLIEVLSDEGHAVLVAENGQDALDCLATAPTLPRVILLDLMMPVMDGREFALATRIDPAFASIPIVLMSASTQLARAAFSLPVAGALPKPINLDQLLATVARYCD